MIRGGLFVIASVLLFIFLLIGNVLMTVEKSLEYENLQKELMPVIKDIAEEQYEISEIVDGNLPVIEVYCRNNSEFVFSKEGGTFEVSCEDAGEGVDAVINSTLENFIEDMYYKDYDCSFIECFEKGKGIPYFLVSEKTKNYFHGKFYLVLLILIGLILVMFFLVKSKVNLLFVLGLMMIVSSLPFMKINSLLSYFAEKGVLKIIAVFFSGAYSVFIYVFSVGLATLIIGIFMKFFGWGFKINEMIQNFSKRFSKGEKESSKQASQNLSSKKRQVIQKSIVSKKSVKKSK